MTQAEEGNLPRHQDSVARALLPANQES